MKIFEAVCVAPGRSSSMAHFERTTRKGNVNSEKLNKTMGVAKAKSHLSVQEKIYLAKRRFDVSEPPPPGLNVNEAFIKEMFTLHVKSVDAIRDLQKKLEESSLLLELERIKCQEKDKCIKELNGNVSQLESDLQREKEAHDRTRKIHQQYLLLHQQRKLELQKEQQQQQQPEIVQSKPKQQTVSKNQSSKTVSSHSDSSKASENSSRKTRGATTPTKPRTYRRHRNSRGPPLLSPAITPNTPFRNSNLEPFLDDKESEDNCEEDELPSDVEPDSAKKQKITKKYPTVIEDDSSTSLYKSYLNSKTTTTTAATALQALGKNYSYDPKVIGDISNEIHKTILNETLENENAKEKARRTRRANSRRSRSSSSEGKMKTRRRRKSRGKSEKSPKVTPYKECLFDSGNTKQLLQRLDTLCQNRNGSTNVKIENDKNESENLKTSKTTATIVSDSQSDHLLEDNISSSQLRTRGRRKKLDPENKCNETPTTTKTPTTTIPIRTITTRNSVARNLANSSFSSASTNNTNASCVSGSLPGGSANYNVKVTPKTTSETVTTSSSAKTTLSSATMSKLLLSPEITRLPFTSVEKAKLSTKTTIVQPLLSPNLKENSNSGMSGDVSPTIAPAVAAVSKIDLPLSSTAAAIPKANSPGTSASAGLPKSEPTSIVNDATVSKLGENGTVKINSVPKSSILLSKVLAMGYKPEDIITKENNAPKEKNLLTIGQKTPLSQNSASSNISQTDVVVVTEGNTKVVSNTPKTIFKDPENIQPAKESVASASSYIERITHGYTRNMNPLIKYNAPTGTFNVQSSTTQSGSVTVVSNKSSDMIVPHKKPICNGNVQKGKNTKKPETITRIDQLPPHYTNDVSLNQVENCMTTLFPYFVLDAPPLVSRKKEKRLVTARAASGVVEVPCWRIKDFAAKILIDKEVEEDDDDSVFLKRHQRPEVDEKRRKRWDSQRMREETYLERLKRRMAEREKQPPHPAKRCKTSKGTSVCDIAEESDDDMESFQPCVEDIRYIRVENDIPIGTFGYPMPIVQKGCFDLPWSPTAAPSIPNSVTNSNNSSKPIFLPTSNVSPRRNGTITINGYASCGSVNSCNIIVPSLASTLPNSISTSNQAGTSVTNVSVSSSSNSPGKEVSVSNSGPGASTRQASKRL